jgi:RHS repeat-associated protein
VLLVASNALPLAADRRIGSASGKATSPRKNRVWGFCRRPSGRRRARRPQVAETASGCRACDYKTVSGRGFWLSRDPIGEQGGVNLYGMVGNDPANRLDYLGHFEVQLKLTKGNPVGNVPIWKKFDNTDWAYTDIGISQIVKCENGLLKIELEFNRATIYFNQKLSGILTYEDWAGTYGHEQRHISNVSIFLRILSAELKAEPQPDCCNSSYVDKWNNIIQKRIDKFLISELSHNGPNSPGALDGYAPKGPFTMPQSIETGSGKIIIFQ